MRRTTLDEAESTYMLYCRTRGLSPRTISTYQRSIREMRRFLQSSGRDPHLMPLCTDLRAFVASQLDRGLSRMTIQVHMRSIRAFANFLEREGIVEQSPMHGVSIPKVPKRHPDVLSEDQIKRLLRAAGRPTWHGTSNLAMALTFLDTGLRLSELIGLDLSDIDLGARAIRVRSGKGDRDRQVFLGRALVRALRRWIEVRSFHESWTPFFLTRRGDRLDLRNVERIVERIAHRAGLQDIRVTPHILRHTFATHYIKNGGDPFSLQRILGHSDIKTTMIYVNLAGVGLREAPAKASPVDRLLAR